MFHVVCMLTAVTGHDAGLGLVHNFNKVLNYPLGLNLLTGGVISVIGWEGNSLQTKKKIKNERGAQKNWKGKRNRGNKKKGEVEEKRNRRKRERKKWKRNTGEHEKMKEMKR